MSYINWNWYNYWINDIWYTKDLVVTNLTFSINFSPVHILIMKRRVSSFKANLNWIAHVDKPVPSFSAVQFWKETWYCLGSRCDYIHRYMMWQGSNARSNKHLLPSCWSCYNTTIYMSWEFCLQNMLSTILRMSQ